MGKRILCVDDDPEIAFILRAWFTDTGHEVDYCLDGADALRLLGEAAYDVVVTDHAMSAMSGLELCRRIRRMPRYRRIPVVLLTAFGEPTPSRFRSAGASEVIRKPVRRDAFLRKMDRFLRDPQAPPPLEAREPPAAAPLNRP